MNNLPIGMFDSGIGGLMLLSQVEHYYPNESVYYLADTAHFPYGDKSREEIIQYSLQNTAFLIEQQIKCLVIACFTASSLAYESILSKVDIPVISVVNSLIEDLSNLKVGSRLAILGTKATIESNFIQNALSYRKDWALLPVIASGLVSSIENRDEGASKRLLQQYRDNFRLHCIDTIALACTHFAHILPLMRECFEEEITIIESSASAASKIASRVELSSIKRPHRFFKTKSVQGVPKDKQCPCPIF
jgi:glutamate racemase